jgi:hypothetical protein
MESRWYFIVGDLAANILVATAAVALSTWLIGGAWGMVPGMLAGMLIGMALALFPFFGLLSIALGVMEVMTPCMLSGMIGGMIGGMLDLTGAEIWSWGSGTGVTVLALVYALNATISGPQRTES